VIGVVGASGGIGTSTVATSLAWSATALGRDVVLVDFDMGGGGLDLPLGLEGVDGLRWPDLADARGVVSSGALRASLPGHDRLRVLAAGRSGGGHDQRAPSTPSEEAVSAVLDAGRRSGGVVVADLGRLVDVAAGSALHLCDHVVLVVAAEVRSVAAAGMLSRAVHRVCADVRLVVRAGARGRLRPRDIGEALGLRCTATVESEPAIGTAADRGELGRALGRGPYSEVTRVLADVIDPRLAA
jgi:secretion/DNA translocation related CpaE-like protein